MRIPESANRGDWSRLVAAAVNRLTNRVDVLASGQVFPSLAAAPSSPVEGQTYFDTVTKKARTWDGTAWQDHW